MAVYSATSNSPVAEALQFIEELTRDVDSVQKRVLSEILSQNSDTEYLSRLGLGGSTDHAEFKSKVPIVSYEDLLPDIERIANGDKSKILCSRPISEFFISSATSSGERRLFPTTDEDMARRIFMHKLAIFVVNHHVPGIDKGKGLYFIFTKAERKTHGSLVAQPASSNRFKSAIFKGIFSEVLQGTSPIEAILCPDTFQSMYTHMLYGLLMRCDVTRIGASFASGLLSAIRFLQLNWQHLAHDIEMGTLSPKVTDPAIRARVAEVLSPNLALAEFISAECRDGNWEGIITRIWPNTKCLDTIVTGGMAHYIPILDHYSNGLPKMSSRYSSSDSFLGINLNPMCNPYEVSYTIMPNMAYFEFIPQSIDKCFDSSTVRVVDLANVEIGKDYEIVVTTNQGLWRYRIGDILRVTGFHNSAPQFRFLRRKNVLLSINGDMTDEAELQVAVQNASVLLKESGSSVLEYTSYADVKALPGHYVIYWELLVGGSTRQPSLEVLEKCCLVMEESLNSLYRKFRAVNRLIGPLEIRVLKNGTFEEFMNYALSNGSSISQYKVPRCVKSEPLVELLNARVVSAHFSPTAPHWSPE